MKRSEIEALLTGELTTDEAKKALVDKILELNGADVNREKSRLDGLRADLEKAQDTLQEREADLEKLRTSAASADDWKNQLEALQSKYTTETEAFRVQLAARDYADAVTASIAAYEDGKGMAFSSKAAEAGFRAALADKALPVENGLLTGFGDFAKAQIAADPDLLKPELPERRFVGTSGGVQKTDGKVDLGIQLARELGAARREQDKQSAEALKSFEGGLKP